MNMNDMGIVCLKMSCFQCCGCGFICAGVVSGFFFPFSFFFCFFYLYIYTHTYIYTCTPVYICVYIAIARAEGLRDSEGRKDENGRESKRKNVFKNDQREGKKGNLEGKNERKV